MLHFSEPYKHAKHYVGFATDLTHRLRHHRNGTGARLMQVVSEAGIDWIVATTWKGSRTDERVFKNRHNTPRECPVCNGKVYACIPCNKTYKYPGWLRRHYMRCHSACPIELIR